MTYNKDINRFLTDENGNKTDITLEANGITAMGYGFSMMIKPHEKLILGMNYRSKVLFEAKDGKATVNDRPAYFPEEDDSDAILPMLG